MRVTALEIPARFACVRENLELVRELLSEGPSDLVLLPEASLTGYVSGDGDFDLGRFAEPLDGPTASVLSSLARAHRTHLVGPLVERDGSRTFNTMVGFDPDGRRVLHYRKRHPWYPERWATAGDLPHPVFSLEGLRITIAVCFDIHFAAELPAADVLLFPSAWVEDAGAATEDSRESLLRGLGMYVVNANWGVGSPRLSGQGGSMVLDATGRPLARADSPGRIEAQLTAGA